MRAGFSSQRTSRHGTEAAYRVHAAVVRDGSNADELHRLPILGILRDHELFLSAEDVHMDFGFGFAALIAATWLLSILAVLVIGFAIWMLSGVLFPDLDPNYVGGSLQGLDEMDSDLAHRLREHGVRSDRDLVNLPKRAQHELEAHLGLKQGQYGRWRAQILHRWRRAYLPRALREQTDIHADPELGGIYEQPPERVDDLTQVSGIDPDIAHRMNAAGIHTFAQLRLLTPEQQSNVQRRFNLTGFDTRLVPRRSLPQRLRENAMPPETSRPNLSAPTHEGLSPTTDGGSVETKLDAKLGELFLAEPMHPDDLTQLPGIDAEAAGRINAEGIFTFAQLHRLTPAQQTQFRTRFAVEIDFDDVQKLTIEATPRAKGPTKLQKIPRSRDDAELGRLYTSPPPHQSDLTLLPGISSEISGALNQAGIYTIDQLLSLSPRQRDHLSARFGIAGPDARTWQHPLSRASRLTAPSSGTSPAPTDSPSPVPVEEDIVFTTSEEIVETHDDFTRLLGIDASRASELHAMGINTFADVAAMNVRQRFELGQRFGLTEADLADWRRCIYAWRRGIITVCSPKPAAPTGRLYSVLLPEVARGVFDGGSLVAFSEQVVYRGHDPTRWGSDHSAEHERVLSRSAQHVRSDINFVRIRRLDTRESVVTTLNKGQLFASGPEEGNGWHGQNDSFFGGRHLGIFAHEVPQEVEIKLGAGGWGFGHRPHRNDHQECSWGGRIIEPTAFEISVGHIGANAGTTVFRSSDPSIWNQHLVDHRDRWAIPLDTVLHPIHFIRLQRLDTGEAIIIRVHGEALLGQSDNPRLGWNGQNDHFFGGHHLGVFHRAVPQDVEIAFGAGGWGFGHPYGENNQQAYGWAGARIGETLFEISVLDSLPVYLEHELVE